MWLCWLCFGYDFTGYSRRYVVMSLMSASASCFNLVPVLRAKKQQSETLKLDLNLRNVIVSPRLGKTFRDQDPSPYSSLITGTKSVPLKGKWLDKMMKAILQ